MGDHRATITLKMEFHGKVYEWGPAWINYQGYDGVDQRVIAFFEGAWSDGMRRFHEAEDEANRVRLEATKEQAELAELARLKAKYEG